MNPATLALIVRISDPAVIALVQHWDVVEELVIRVYRNGVATAQDQAEFDGVMAWLRENQPVWSGSLKGHWRGVTIKGLGPPIEDPFEALLKFDSAADFVNNWEALRILPAIRQAINEWLLDIIRAGHKEGD